MTGYGDGSPATPVDEIDLLSVITDKFGWYYFPEVDATDAGAGYHLWLYDPLDTVTLTVYAGQITEQNFPPF